MNISVILVAFSLFWETIQNKESKGCLSTICEWFSCNLRYPFNFLNISTAPASCHRSDFPHPRWNDEKPSPPVPCQPNKQQRHQAILLYVEPQIKPWRTIDLPTLKADSHHSQLWSKRLQTMTLVALKNVQLEAVGSIISVNADAKTL